jgi:hypothetical protein
MFPVLSGMEDGRKRTSARAIRLTSAFLSNGQLDRVYPYARYILKVLYGH